MRLLLLLALLATASSGQAQDAFELADPLLLIDGQRVPVAGVPLFSASFQTLDIEVPEWGTLTVATVPFDGARRAGDFDGARLVLVAGGRSVRLRSRTPLLPGTAGVVPAYARLVEDPDRFAAGPVQLRLRRLPEVQPTPVAPQPETPRPAPENSPPENSQRVNSPQPDPDRPDANTTDALTHELDDLRAERDLLYSALSATEDERDDARQRLAALRDEVERLRLEITGTRQPVAQLRAERDALREEVIRLRASLEAVGTPPALPAAPTDPAPALTHRISLPGFDTSRLANRAEIEAQLRATPYPEWADYNGIGGDVLVLLQTDVHGAVIRTAVPRPIGGGLDALAEEIVRAMRFVPVRADGQPTRLRSQVVVRFTP